MASRLPIVATRVGEVPSVVKDMKTGLIVDPQCSEDIKSALLFLLENPELCKKMGEQGYSRVAKHYTATKSTKDYMELFESLF